MSDTPPEPHNWGRWGADDQIGAANLLTPEVVKGGAGAVARGRAPVPRNELLRDHVAALERRGGARRPENRPARRLESIDDAAIERQLGPDDGEVHGFAFGQRQQPVDIADGHRGVACHGTRSGVPGRADYRRDLRIPGETGGEGVLAAAGADDKYLHRHSRKVLESKELTRLPRDRPAAGCGRRKS
jgi:hypothetical protein